MGSARFDRRLLRQNVKLHGGRALVYAYGLGDSRYVEYASTLEELGALRQDDLILDIGSGHSILPTLLRSRVVVLDRNRDALKNQLSNARHVGKEVEAVTADAQSLPFKPEAFSAIVSISVIEHIPEDAEAWRELMRVLKGGGRAVVTLPGYLDGEKKREDPFEGVPPVYKKLFPGFLRRTLRRLNVDRGEAYYEFRYTAEDVKERITQTSASEAYEIWGARSRFGRIARLMIEALRRTLIPFSTITALEYLFAKNLRTYLLNPNERSGLLVVKVRKRTTDANGPRGPQ